MDIPDVFDHAPDERLRKPAVPAPDDPIGRFIRREGVSARPRDGAPDGEFALQELTSHNPLEDGRLRRNGALILIVMPAVGIQEAVRHGERSTGAIAPA